MKLKFGTEPISWLDVHVWDEKTYAYYSAPCFPRNIAKSILEQHGNDSVHQFFKYFLSLPIEEQKSLAEETFEEFSKNHSQWNSL